MLSDLEHKAAVTVLDLKAVEDGGKVCPCEKRVGFVSENNDLNLVNQKNPI
jgi:hypothetical protein